MQHVNYLCVCNSTTKTYRRKILKFIQNRLKNIQLINYALNKCISCKKQEITIIFLKISPNLSLYLLDRYDKNLSLIYIWSHDYINVSMTLISKTARNCPTICKIKQEIVRQFTLIVRQFSANNKLKSTGDLIS